MRRQFVIRSRNITIEIERVSSEAIHMFSQIGTQPGQSFVFEAESLLRQLTQQPRQSLHIMKDQAIGYDVVVLDDLSLFVTIILRNHPVPAEEAK